SLVIPATVEKLADSLPTKRCQSSCAFNDLGERRRLRRLRLTHFRWLTRAGPRAIATPMASTSITTRWAIREVHGVYISVSSCAMVGRVTVDSAANRYWPGQRGSYVAPRLRGTVSL